jgi:hypothetical protein
MPLNAPDLLSRLLAARTTAQVEAIMAALPIVPPEQYQWISADERCGPWQPGKLHWVPVGRDRGNGGRIKLAGEPMNPLAERLVNGMESLIELARLRELLKNSTALAPTSPRDAVQRYFGFPKLDSIERLDDDDRKAKRALVDKMRKNLSIKLDFEKKSKQFAVSIRDHGMGQTPAYMHNTLLSLGRTDKADKPYLIGVFGQGGSSAFSIAKYSIVVSRRAPQPPEKPEKKTPRLVDGEFKTGSMRRPPYELKTITRDDYGQPCWNAPEWTDEDAGAFLEPTERAPLILIINQDMAALREFRQALAKRNTEQDVQRKLNKYTSHIAFHLYQMYQETIGKKDDDVDVADAARRAEVRRVAMTMIKLMDVAEK